MRGTPARAGAWSRTAMVNAHERCERGHRRTASAMTDWTPEAVKARLEEAARTLRRLPGGEGYPREYGSNWPEIVRTAWEVLEAMEGLRETHKFVGDDGEVRSERRMVPFKPRPAPALAAEITRMDEAFVWLVWVTDAGEIRRLREIHGHTEGSATKTVRDREDILWERAKRKTWRKLEEDDGRSRETLRKIHTEGVEAILRRLANGVREN